MLLKLRSSTTILKTAFIAKKNLDISGLLKIAHRFWREKPKLGPFEVRCFYENEMRLFLSHFIRHLLENSDRHIYIHQYLQVMRSSR